MAKDLSLSEPYPQDQTAMLQYLMQINPELAAQVAPTMSPLTQGMLAGFAPRASNIGTTGATNYAQDLASIGFDDAFAAYGGPGAYAEGAFNPVTTSNIVDTPGRRRLQQAMQQGTSVDSIIARVLFEGGAPGDAVAEVNRHMQDALTAGENATPEQQMLLAQIPRNPDPAAPEGTMLSFDPNFVNNLVRDMNDLAMSDPPEGSFAPIIGPNGEMIRPGGERRWVDDGQGGEVLVEFSSEPSEVAQQYIDQGLSLPTDEYTPESLLGPDWQEAAGALAGSREVQDAASRAMRANQQDPMLAARQSEMNEIPYGGPTNDAMRAEAPDVAAAQAQSAMTANPYSSGVQGAYSFPDVNVPSGSIAGGPGTSVLTPESVMAGTYVPAANMTDQAATVSPYDSDLGRPIRELLATLAQPDQEQLLQILGQAPGVQAAAGQNMNGATMGPAYGAGAAPPPPPAVDPNAPPDVYSDSMSGPLDRLNAELGTNYGGGPGRSRRIMPQGKMLGGQGPEPQPGTPEWWAAQQNGGYNVPGQAPVDPNVSGPPPPQPTPAAPDWYAYQGGYGTEGPQTTTAPGLVNNTQMGPIPGSPEWLEMQTGFQGNPTATDALSYQNNQRHLNYPDQPEYNALSGGSANAGSLPQGGGVLGIGDYLNQYVMGGGTQPHAGPPAQPEYNPLPQNPTSGPGSAPSAGVTPLGPLQPGIDTLLAIMGQQQAPTTGRMDQAPPGDTVDLASWLIPRANDPDRRTNNNQTTYSTGSPVMDMGPAATNRASGRGNYAPTSRVSGDPRAILDQLWRPEGAERTRGTATSRTERRQPTAAMLQAILGQQPTRDNDTPTSRVAGSPASGALWQQLWQQAQEAGSTYDPLSSANAGSLDSGGGTQQQTAGTGRRSSGASDELREYNEGVGERAGSARRRAQKNLGYRQEDVDRWKAAVETNKRERSYYGAEYGRAAGLAWMMQRAGIRPLDRQLAARGAVASGMGLRPS